MEEVYSIRCIHSNGTFCGLFICADARPAAGTADLCLGRRCRPRDLHGNAGAGRSLSLEHPRTRFTTKYEEMHRFVTEPNGTVTLVVGAENWPLPIPLVNKNGAWYFDTLGGKDEILFRRIGKNELAAIQACSDLVDAQKQYYVRAPYGFAKE